MNLPNVHIFISIIFFICIVFIKISYLYTFFSEHMPICQWIMTFSQNPGNVLGKGGARVEKEYFSHIFSLLLSLQTCGGSGFSSSSSSFFFFLIVEISEQLQNFG